MSEEAIDKVFNGTTALLDVCDEMNELALAFNITGNTAMADTIWRLREKTYSAKKEISKGMSQEINDRFNASQQATVNMVNAALAGAASVS